MVAGAAPGAAGRTGTPVAARAVAASSAEALTTGHATVPRAGVAALAAMAVAAATAAAVKNLQINVLLVLKVGRIAVMVLLRTTLTFLNLVKDYKIIQILR